MGQAFLEFMSSFLPTRQGDDPLILTSGSITAEAPKDSEIVVVDGSDEPLGGNYVKAMVSNENVKMNYTIDKKKGVFQKLKANIVNSSKR